MFYRSPDLTHRKDIFMLIPEIQQSLETKAEGHLGRTYGIHCLKH